MTALDTLITNARVITCDAASTVIEDGYVGIAGGKIASVGAMADLNGTAPPGTVPQRAANVVDGSGTSVLPGLVNAHMHFHYRRLRGPVGPNILGPVALDALKSTRTAFNLLREGVTTVRDLGHNDDARLHVRDAVHDGVIVGPAAAVSGAAIGMAHGHADFVAENITTLDALVATIRRQAHEGVDLIKIIASNEDLRQPPGAEIPVPWFSRKAVDVAVETAHECGLPIAAHANGTRTLDWCIDAGVDSIEHGIYLSPDHAAAMAERGIALVPTLSGFFENSRTFWGRSWQPRYAALWEVHQQTIRNAVEAGVLIGTGTDTLGTVAQEAWLLHTFGGATAQQALDAATRNGAQIVGRADSVGSIVLGHRADLVMVDGAPDRDLRDLGRARRTFLGGIEFTRAELSKLIPHHAHFVDELDGPHALPVLPAASGAAGPA
ncbi:amidohydrolase family protein [Dactylosporangium sp. NPDC000555]|uniref:amidohydrolase family protein n=1 Tax=Dactylosporangium sp. NPDC000555 TaxID=3154260 RepID=UPI003320F53A